MHVTSASMAVFLFFCIVSTANLLRIPFYLDYKEFEMNIVILAPFADKILWVVSGLAFSILLFAISLKKGLKGLRAISVVLFVFVVVASVLAFFSNFSSFGIVTLLVAGLGFSLFSILMGKSVFGNRKNTMALVILYGILLLLLIEAASLARWIYNLFSPSLVFADASWSIAFAEVQISSVLYPVLSVLLIIFCFSWIGELTVKGFSVKDKSLASLPKENHIGLKIKSFRLSFLIIFFSVFAALFIGYYHSAVAGVFNQAFPGTDVPYYIQHLNEMRNSRFFDALSLASKDDRFLYLVFQYFCFPNLGLSPEFLVTYAMPVLLSFLLMISCFVFVRSGQSSFHAITAMLVSVFSFTVTVGVYAGFFANWFALSLVYCFYGLLVTVLKGHKNPFLLLLVGLMSVAVLFTHPWTWILLIITLLTSYLLMTFAFVWMRKNSTHSYTWEMKFILILLIINVLMFYVRQVFGFGSGGGLTDGYTNAATSTFSLFNVFRLKYFLDQTFNWYVGGFYAYAPIMLFAILGVFSTANYENRYNRLLLIWILIGSLMVFMEFPLHTRFLYDMPINIFAANGISYLGEMLFNFVDATEMRRLAHLVFWSFYLLSILFLFNYTIRCMVLMQFGGLGLTSLP